MPSCGDIWTSTCYCPQRRLCFHRCLWFCSQGGCIPACTETDTPLDGHCSGQYASYWNAFLFIVVPFLKAKLSNLLVSTYVVCERLSVMHYTFQLPEFLVQNSESSPTLWTTPLPSPPNADLDRSWHYHYPPEFQGARMWRLIAVSPVDTISFPW